MYPKRVNYEHEKIYNWQDGSFGYKEKPEAEWELDPNADPLEMANQLEELGREAVKMARHRG